MHFLLPLIHRDAHLEAQPQDCNQGIPLQETPFDDEMGLGYCTFSKIVRKGIIEIINLISEYYSAVKRAEQANNSLKINEEFLTEIFGTKDIADYQLSDDEKSRIKAVVKEIQEKWESED